jgi:hypothetical protein
MTTTTHHDTAPLPFDLIVSKANRIQGALELTASGTATFEATRLTLAALAFLEHADAVQIHNPGEAILKVSLL